MPSPGSFEELSSYTPGSAMDRVGLMVRRRQLEQQRRAQEQQAAPRPPPPSAAQPQKAGVPDRWGQVAARLWEKGIPAKTEVSPGVFSYARPGEGIVAYGDLPTSVTSKIPSEPIVGWDPSTLDSEEKFLLNYLVAMRQKEAAARDVGFANDPEVQGQIRQ